MRTTTILLVISSSLLLFNCDEEKPTTVEELVIDSCTLEPNYVSTEGWQEIYIDLPNQTLMSFPNTYTTWLGPTFDTWAFNADREDNEVSFCVEQGWGTDSPELLKEPLPLSYRDSDGRFLFHSSIDTNNIIGALYFGCDNQGTSLYFGCGESKYPARIKGGSFFLKKDSSYQLTLNMTSTFENWDEAITILSTARKE
jgi:hypothetical protein